MLDFAICALKCGTLYVLRSLHKKLPSLALVHFVLGIVIAISFLPNRFNLKLHFFIQCSIRSPVMTVGKLKKKLAPAGYVAELHVSVCLMYRCMDSFKRIFMEAGLSIIKQENQLNWPENMFQVTM